MAKDKNKTGRTPQNDPKGTPKPDMDSGSMKQKSDRDRESEGRVREEEESGNPKSSRTGQRSTPDRNSQRIEEDLEDDDMDFRPSRTTGSPRNR